MIWTEEDYNKIKNRDPDLFGKIYKEYSGKIYNFILIKTNGNEDLSAEILSETFHSALLYAPKLKDINKILNWLLQIASRRYCDLLRKKYRDKKYFNFKNNEQSIDSIIDNSSNGLSEEINDDNVILTKIALENIKPEYKDILLFKYNDHMTQKEIATALKKSESAVENLLFKARNSLKTELLKLSKDLKI